MLGAKTPPDSGALPIMMEIVACIYYEEIAFPQAGMSEIGAFDSLAMECSTKATSEVVSLNFTEFTSGPS
jgi:hypothetical protein